MVGPYRSKNNPGNVQSPGIFKIGRYSRSVMWGNMNTYIDGIRSNLSKSFNNFLGLINDDNSKIFRLMSEEEKDHLENIRIFLNLLNASYDDTYYNDWNDLSKIELKQVRGE